MDSRYNNNNQECSDGNESNLRNGYNMIFCDVGKTSY